MDRRSVRFISALFLLVTPTLHSAQNGYHQQPQQSPDATQTCPKEPAKKLPSDSGVYYRKTDKWIALHPVEPKQDQSWFPIVASTAVGRGSSVLLKGVKAKARTGPRPIFVVRQDQLASLTITIAKVTPTDKYREADLEPWLSGKGLIDVIAERSGPKNTACVTPKADLPAGEYLLVGYSPGNLVGSLAFAYEFGVDDPQRAQGR